MGVAETRLYCVVICLGSSSSLLRKWPSVHKYHGSLVVKEHDCGANVVPGKRNISKFSFTKFFVTS